MDIQQQRGSSSHRLQPYRHRTPTSARKFRWLSYALMKIVKRLYRRRSLFLAVLLFFLSIGVPLVAAKVSASTSIAQTQQNPLRLVEQGRALYEAGHFEQAVTAWQQATSAFAARGDKLNQAMALSNLSLTAQQLGRWDEAKEAIASSLNLLRSQERTQDQLRILASTLDIQGQLQLAQGQSEAALKTWQQTADIYGNIGDQDGEARSQINQAQSLQDLGLYPRACKTLLKALKLNNQDCEISEQELQTPKDSVNTPNLASLQILGLRSLGNVLQVIGQLEQSQMVLLKSWQLAQQLDDPQNKTSIYLSLGNTARALGNRKIQLEQPSQQQTTLTQSVDCIQRASQAQAVEFYQQAATCYRQAESSASLNTRVQAQLNLLSLLLQTRQWSQVPTLLLKIQSHLDRLPASRPTVYAQMNLAQSLMCLRSGLSQEQSELSSPILQQCTFARKTAKSNNIKALHSSEAPSWQDISLILTAALKQAQSLKDKRATASAFGYLGGAYQQMGKLAEAQQFTEQALQQSSAIEAPDITYLWLWQLGRLRQIQQDQKGALQAYTLAFEILQSLRQDLVTINPEIQFTFRDSVEPVYRELVDLLLQPPAYGTPSFAGRVSQENLKQARDAIEALQLAELDNFFQEACVDAKPQQIDQVVDRANPSTAAFYAIILKNRLEVILKLPQQEVLEHYTTRLPQNAQNVLEELQQYLADITRTRKVRELSQEVYSWLIQPAETKLAASGVKNLVFVLDGRLRNIPMAVLYDSQQYLVEKYAIALTPGLQLLNPRPLGKSSLNVLIGGVSESRQIQGREFSALENVELELRKVQAVVPSAEQLLNEDFIKNKIQDRLDKAKFTVVHMATHGQFSSNPDDTFILLSNSLLKVKDLENLLRTSSTLR